MGCSSGPNTLSTIKEILDALDQEVASISSKLVQSLPPVEFRVYLNDLPTNDFNAIFQALPDFYKDLKRKNEAGGSGSPSVYVAAYPGTFYGRLFPMESLHFIYASYSLHWLSRVPPGIYDEKGRSLNKGSIYISECSPAQVARAYFDQFQEDFSLFLRSRSEELVPGGQMTIILLGRECPNHVDRGNSFFWKILFRSLATLVDKGVVKEEKLDSYDVHFYAPSKEELEDMVKREGSLKLERLEMFEMEKDAGDFTSYGARVAMTVRAIQESMISHHFGEEILEDLFEIYGRLVDEEMARQDIRAVTYVVVLRKF